MELLADCGGEDYVRFVRVYRLNENEERRVLGIPLITPFPPSLVKYWRALGRINRGTPRGTDANISFRLFRFKPCRFMVSANHTRELNAIDHYNYHYYLFFSLHFNSLIILQSQKSNFDQWTLTFVYPRTVPNCINKRWLNWTICNERQTYFIRSSSEVGVQFVGPTLRSPFRISINNQL